MNQNLLTRITEHCFSTVPHYKKLFESSNNDFFSLPTLSKDQIVSNPLDFLSDAYLKRYEQGRLINKKTSGSTGTCLDIYWSHNDETLTSLEVWKYRNIWYNVSIKDRYVSFHTTVYRANRLVENDLMTLVRGNNLSLSKNLLCAENIDTSFELISDFNATWMFTQPSILQILLKYASRVQLNHLNKLKYIELTGEYLPKTVLDYFEQMLPDVKFANMYGTTETGTVALQCPYGHMHILQNALVEVFDDHYEKTISTEGKIVLSTLKNYAMPLLRYRIGDIGFVKPTHCPCGFDGSDINITVGREGDIIYCPDGNYKSCYCLLKAVEFVNDEFNNPITQFNFVQDSDDSLIMYLQLKPSFYKWRQAIEQSLRGVLMEELSAFRTINIVFDRDADFVHNNKIKFFERRILL